MGETDALSGRNGSSSGVAPSPPPADEPTATSTLPFPTSPPEQNSADGRRRVETVVDFLHACAGVGAGDVGKDADGTCGAAVATLGTRRRGGIVLIAGTKTKAIEPWHKHTKRSNGQCIGKGKLDEAENATSSEQTWRIG